MSHARARATLYMVYPSTTPPPPKYDLLGNQQTSDHPPRPSNHFSAERFPLQDPGRSHTTLQGRLCPHSNPMRAMPIRRGCFAHGQQAVAKKPNPHNFKIMFSLQLKFQIKRIRVKHTHIYIYMRSGRNTLLGPSTFLNVIVFGGDLIVLQCFRTLAHPARKSQLCSTSLVREVHFRISSSKIATL